MKRITKLMFIVALLSAMLLLLIACAGSDYKVSVTVDDGAVITGDSSVTVSPGESVSFNITIKDGYVFDSVSQGEYDEANGVLRISSVKTSLSVRFNTKPFTPEQKKLGFVFRKG
ncbi:MAG: hypothetical protein IJY24_02955 [Clostridia bacterium]|nr:hypothetical protein [Clostridia bacterium]